MLGRLHPSSSRSLWRVKSRHFLECRNLLRSIFSFFIWTIGALATLQRLLCIFSVCFVLFGQMAFSSLPLLSLDQTSSQRSKVFCSDASSMVALAWLTSCFSAECPESHSLHFPFLVFALLYPLASLAAIYTSSLLLMFL